MVSISGPTSPDLAIAPELATPTYAARMRRMRRLKRPYKQKAQLWFYGIAIIGALSFDARNWTSGGGMAQLVGAGFTSERRAGLGGGIGGRRGLLGGENAAASLEDALARPEFVLEVGQVRVHRCHHNVSHADRKSVV